MRHLLSAAAILVVTATPLLAADGTPARVRGTIESLSATSLTVTSREGPSLAIAIPADLAVRGVKAAEAADIKTGDFVGVASIPTAAGGDGALEVLIFPAAMKGTGEGSYPWDLQEGSTMTNATVSNAVESVDGRSLTLTYPEGSKTVALPEGIPVVTFDDASRADLVKGATVFVPAQKAADGTLSTAFVVVGKNGVVPPM
ncbi:hypothetical protein ASG43_02995 [Aureimonas sp. Leaf454]|uniref:hypothetical protein n=1 Tax=Aureimonas sp. Leaf454 TaxID=1736381 RepID=UPI0006F25601|nr:hypothetical protein [Aureimonas sp. Leaf454]KQT54568.1 hypothetical protein ASG43_02995 [Aureimonas sp. Leaf454]